MKAIWSRQFRLFGYCSCHLFRMLSTPGHVLAISSVAQIRLICSISHRKTIKHLDADPSCESDTEDWIWLDWA